jgi:hypothetical protein
MDRLQTVAGVERVSLATSIPMWSSWSEYFAVPGIDSLPKPGSGGPYLNAVTPEHFRVLGMRIVHGRGIEPSDVDGAPLVTVVNEAMAQAIWPGEDPVGRCVVVGAPDAPCTEVVGVVANSRRQSVIEGEQWTYFLSLAQPTLDYEPEALFVRGSIDLGQLSLVVQRTLSGGVPGVRYAIARPLQDLIDPQLRSWRLGAAMLSAFGLLALIVAGVGLYSLLSFNVSQRSHEIGVRTALGASRGRILTLVLRQAVLLSAIGIVLGLVAALAAGGAVRPLLYQVSPQDPAVFGAVIVGLLAVAILAGSIPAWRASRVEPSRALRVD